MYRESLGGEKKHYMKHNHPSFTCNKRFTNIAKLFMEVNYVIPYRPLFRQHKFNAGPFYAGPNYRHLEILSYRHLGPAEK